MSDILPGDLQRLIAKIPKDSKYPLERIREPGAGYTPLQASWLRRYGERFTASELAWLMNRQLSSVGNFCRRLGVTLIKPQRKLARARVMPKKEAPAQADRYITVQGIGSNEGRARYTMAEPSPMLESLQAYTPEKPDYDAGWWLNNAILHKMGLRKLGPDGCSWIEGDPRDDGSDFCSKPRERASVYCPRHHALAYTKPPGAKANDDTNQEGAGPGAAANAKARVFKNDAGAEGSARRGGRSRHVGGQRL